MGYKKFNVEIVKEPIKDHEKNIPIPQKPISDHELSLKQTPLTEKPSEDLQNGNLQIIRADSWILKREGNKITAKDGTILHECQFCRELKKTVFFNSQSDLDLHIQRIHGESFREVE